MSDARLTNGSYGFAWGPLAVTRMAEINGRVVLSITTDAGREIHIYASRTGRSLRVFSPGGPEWKPTLDAALDGEQDE